MEQINIHHHGQGVGKYDIRSFDLNDFDPNWSGLFSIGMHPWFLDHKELHAVKPQLQKIIERPNCVGIGEAGFDKLIELEQEEQLPWFEMQYELALQNDKVLFLHLVRSYDYLLGFLKKQKAFPSMIIHGYQANFEIANQLMKYPVYFSFGAALLKGNSKVLKCLKLLPLQRIFLETDDSAITIDKVYEVVVNHLNIEMYELQEIVGNNYKLLFNK